MPFVDRLRPLVDMREQVVAFPPQPVITQDNVTISIDTVFYFTVTDAFRATYEVSTLLIAIEQLTVTTLRNVIGSLSLEDVLTSRDKINADLRIVLDEATERWGLRVNRIELKSIDPPCSIQEAMEKQMRAERERRAVIINAEGVKQAQITTAEGEKQAAILTAEGAKTAAILTAEGSKQSTILHAQGEAEATRQVFQAIHDGNPSPDLLSYQYIQNLPRVADGQAMKLMIIPSDAMARWARWPRSAAASSRARRRPRTSPAALKALARVAIVVWIILALVLAGVELLTLSFVAVYPAIGAVAAALTAAVGGSVGIQLLVFAAVSVAALLLTRKPLLRLMSRTPQVPSNAPTVVGKRAVVVIPIEPGPASEARFGWGQSTGAPARRTSTRSMRARLIRIDVVTLVVRPSGLRSAALRSVERAERSVRRRSRARVRTRARRLRRRPRRRSRSRACAPGASGNASARRWRRCRPRARRRARRSRCPGPRT